MANAGSQSQPAVPSLALRRLAAQAQLDFELEFFAALLERKPDYVEVLKMHAKNLAHVRRHDEGLAIDKRIAQLLPADSLAHYNLACSLSITRHHEEAIAVLRQAIKLGYDDFAFMKQDRDLDPIRKDPRFRALLREHERHS